VTRLTKLRPDDGRVLRVRFAGDRRDQKRDKTGLIARSAHFAPLMDDAETFAKAAIVEDGLGVVWPVRTKWGPLDVSASTLRRIAQDQQPMTGADFAEWRVALGLSLTEAAAWSGPAHHHGLFEERGAPIMAPSTSSPAAPPFWRRAPRHRLVRSFDLRDGRFMSGMSGNDQDKWDTSGSDPMAGGASLALQHRRGPRDSSILTARRFPEKRAKAVIEAICHGSASVSAVAME
jgi:hypothetical protein